MIGSTATQLEEGESANCRWAREDRRENCKVMRCREEGRPVGHRLPLDGKSLNPPDEWSVVVENLLQRSSAFLKVEYP